MTVAGFTVFKGISLEIEADATPYFPSTYDHPAEGGDFNIYSVKVNGINIIELLSDDTIQEIAEHYTLEAFDKNDF